MTKKEELEDIIFQPQAGFQEAFASSNVDVVFGGGILAAGKMGLLDSHIVTPFGLRKVRDIKVGDIISNPDTGGQERVIQLHPIGTFPFYRVSFCDGTHMDCSEGHLWKVRVAGKATKRKDKNGNRDDWRIWDAKMMFNFMEAKKKGVHPQWGLSIPISQPVQFTRPNTPLSPRPINPYILGALIGDGCMTIHTIQNGYCLLSTPDDFIVQKFVENGYDMSNCSVKKDVNCKCYRIKNKDLIDGLKTLKLAGHKAESKFIPEAYKYATIEERKELLRGLIDTDGYVETKGCIVYTTISETLANDVAFVVRSIGGRASISSQEAGYKDKDGVYHKCQRAYNISIATPFDNEIVSLPKKLERTKTLGYKNGKKWYFEKSIASVEYIGEREGRCITVDNPSGLYLVDDFIVTHNSFGLVLSMAEPLMTDPDFRALISRKNLGSLKSGGGFVDTFQTIFGEYVTVRQADSPRVTFENGAYCDLTYIDDSNLDKMRERAKGWQYDMIAIDELTEMSWEAFSYMMTRNRGRSKTFTGKFFATMNPKRSHWARTFLDWYIGVDGYIRPERDGVVRYFYVNGATVRDVVWGNSKEEVYRKCKIDIDRKLKAVGGNFSYKNMIKSFVFYQGKLSENKGLINGNENYIGSVAASGGKMGQVLLEGNWNVDPEENEKIPIPSDKARDCFINDMAVNGDLWVTVDLADFGTDNLVALAWNGFHVYDIMIISHSTPRENAKRVKIFADEHGTVAEHIIYDGTAGRYLNDYIPEAIAFLSATKPQGIYYLTAMSLKDLCYLRLVRMINNGHITFEDKVAQSQYVHQNIHNVVSVQNEFLEECAVVRFMNYPSGKKRLMTKKQMNQMLGKGRSMDLLDPCAMRMLPCVELEYGTELAAGFEIERDRTSGLAGYGETVNIYDNTLWA